MERNIMRRRLRGERGRSTKRERDMEIEREGKRREKHREIFKIYDFFFFFERNENLEMCMKI